jgi:hypothetical protein
MRARRSTGRDTLNRGTAVCMSERSVSGGESKGNASRVGQRMPWPPMACADLLSPSDRSFLTGWCFEGHDRSPLLTHHRCEGPLSIRLSATIDKGGIALNEADSRSEGSAARSRHSAGGVTPDRARRWRV